jgi:hypothetical protein
MKLLKKVFYSALILLIIISAVSVYAGKNEEKDKTILRGLIRNTVDLRADWIRIEIHEQWAFIDVAEKDIDGDWIAGISALGQKTDGIWKIVAMGSPVDESWKPFYKRMTPEVRKAYDEWAASQV